ncbi:hypothetical protein [Rhizobium sp. CECT 9324]|uniref:hypothetical protein n=1 Tax=Rhizobium sp. CECT 9324 TaxID=2845820 RepID=UPI001E59245E|nr:hypothetical protein [Rhizobium sp. CECT 9324]CAH0339596.1 hypothetical protein RHI9324_01247 [Rhizobium sp. CECT 9324]
MSSKWPGILSDIVDIAGTNAAFAIAQSHGGTRVSIPPRATPDHWLTILLGFEKADKICQGLATLDPDGKLRGVQNEMIPRGPASMQAAARRVAQDALDNGTSARETARLAGLHERTIWRMKAKGDPDQGSLF